MELIDLSHTIYDKMPVYPSDSPVHLFQERWLAKDQHNNFRLKTSMHAGTHIDSPMHLTTSTDFSEKVKERDIVLLHTGHDVTFGKESYFEKCPVIDLALAEFFIAKKIKMLGIDTPSPDTPPFLIHKLLFSYNILIIENMTNLGKLLDKKNIEIIAFPLKIRADSSLVRVVARIDQDLRD